MPKSIGPVRSSRYYYIAWAAEWRAIYAHAGGSPEAHATLCGQGQRPVRLQRRRVPLQRHRSSGSTTRFSPHNLYATGAKLRSLGKKIGAKDKAYKTVWQFAPGRAARGAPVRRHDHRQVPVQHDQLQVRPQDQHLPPLGDRREEADRRRRTTTRIAPKNVVVMRMRFGPLNDGHPGAPRLEATRRRQRAGLDLDQRPDDQGHLEEDRR